VIPVVPNVNGKRSEHKRTMVIGPGGMNCTCCGPAPGDTRKRAMRTSKRREKREAMRQAREDANECKN
jgi:hypothetical protein